MSPASYLIVGANRGIGLGLVKETLKLYPEAKVFATAREPAKATALNELVKANDGRLVVLKADILDEASLEAAAKELKTHTTTISTAIFNAGVLLGQVPLASLASSTLLDNLNVNIVGPHNLFKVFSPFVLASKDEHRTIASLSTITSSIAWTHNVAGFLKGAYEKEYSPLAGYSVTKTGSNMLARQWAEVLEPQGVAVALVHPGFVATDMTGNLKGLISVDDSTSGLMAQLAALTIEKAGTGILSYDGSVIPW